STMYRRALPARKPSTPRSCSWTCRVSRNSRSVSSMANANIAIVELVEQGPQPPAVVLVQAVVGVEPEDPIAGGVAEAFGAGGGEAFLAGEVVNLGPVAGGDRLRGVGEAGVHDDDLVRQVGVGVRTGGQVGLLGSRSRVEGDSCSDANTVRLHKPDLAPR